MPELAEWVYCPADYEEHLARFIATTTGPVQYDRRTGCLWADLDCGGELFLTPGWDDEPDALSWCVVDTEYRVVADGVIPMGWTRDLTTDATTYRAILWALVAAFPSY
jgi:hypothetical protein